MVNERVKLLADIKEAAAKRGCRIPDEAAMSILNDPENEKVFKTTSYTKVPWNAVDALIEKRKALY
ncbi:MAG: hypothetical protein LBT00_11675 [Spirochaetaceae bacterium]|jgi:hypothetical protein|nr:hypothetical protein [Spirochaetaceae bacterium]